MASRARLAAVLVLVAAAVVRDRAQSDPSTRPQFRAGVEYVQVDARVVDANGQPVAGLTQNDFTVFEDGARQTLKTFVAVDLPLPPTSGRFVSSSGVKPDVSSNVMTALRGRTYLIVLDTLNINSLRTAVTRKFLNTFIERSIGPDDLVGVATTGVDAAHQSFTNDKTKIEEAINQLFGQGGSPTVENADSIVTKAGRSNLGGPTLPAIMRLPSSDVVLTRARVSQNRLQEYVATLGAAQGGSKAIILISESIPFEMITNTDALVLIGGSERLRQSAQRGNVPIYPVDPRGLTSGGEDSIQVGQGGLDDSPGTALLAEVRRSQDRLRILADDSGGVPIIKNDIQAALDHVVQLSSRYYTLGYDSTNPPSNGKYRRITVRVNRPGVTVLARHGYSAHAVVSTAPPKESSLAGPPGASSELREALNAVVPMPDLPMLTTAAAFRQPGGRNTSVAIVLETSGTDLAWRENDSLAAPIEMTAIAIDAYGGVRTGFVDHARFESKSDAGDRVKTFGFRWLARLTDVKPGHYQVRVAAANGPGRQGSVWLDLDIPDFFKPALAMSDVLISSVFATQRPTLRPDKLLADALPAPPTTLRQYLANDAIAIYGEVYDNTSRQHDVETSVAIISAGGEQIVRTAELHPSAGGVIAIKARPALTNLSPGRYTLVIEARDAANRSVATGRAVPFQIVDAGKK